MPATEGHDGGRAVLRGRVTVVVGATRGAGRGVAAALGEAGATVVCTGRSSAAGGGGSDYDRPETIEGTPSWSRGWAARGSDPGRSSRPRPGAALGAPHPRRARPHRRAGQRHLGRRGPQGPPTTWNTPIWTHDLDAGLRILRLAVDTHLITSHHLLPLMIDEPGGLLVEVTDRSSDHNASRYRISVFHDLAKVAVNRLAFSQGHELAPHGATAVAITPWWLRSEMMLDNSGVTEDNWRDALVPGKVAGHPTAPEGFASSESPRYVGRAVAALAADPARARWNQRSVTSAQLAREYGFTDVDGSRPDSWAVHQDAAPLPASSRQNSSR
jgi:NAD(P)-dependent dehydrogenase (short-subunit alcohol dehydrogenase family)